MASVNNAIRGLEQGFVALEAKQLQDIRGVLEKHFAGVKIDKTLGKRIYHFQISYVNTSKEYVEFFGSNLLGVHVVRFRTADVLRFFNDVLNIDFSQLESDIRAIDSIVHTYKIGGDILNLTLLFLISKIFREKSLSEKDRTWIAYNTALVFFYRATAAVLSAYFTYPSDPKIAQAAYANLSNKFLIKKLGSWHKVMDYRATVMSSKQGTQYGKITRLESDAALVEVINDGANSISDMIQNYCAVFFAVKERGENITTTSSTIMNADGKEEIRDRLNNVDKSVAFVRHCLTDTNSFVKDDYIRIIADINKNTSPRLVKETLLWMTQHLEGSDFKLLNDWVSKIVVFSFYLIETRIEPQHWKDKAYVLIQLKNYYLSSRSTETDLIEIRELGDKVLAKAHKKLSSTLSLSTRTAIILYVSFRALVGNSSH